MRTYLDCLPCFLNQALRAGRKATDNDSTVKKLLDEIGMLISRIPMEQTPPETGEIIYNIISKITRNPDPFEEIKKKNISQALELYPTCKKIVTDSKDPLLTAIRFSIAGNVIDLGTGKSFNLNKDVYQVLQQDFAIFHYENFKEKLKLAKNILYIADNSGEGVFDKILIEELGKTTYYAVRNIPVINDITIKEAKLIGLNKIANVFSSGSNAPGTILKDCNENFINLFKTADLIISKGQGNYESLSDVDTEIFFLLKAKCKIIANHIGVRENDIVFMSQREDLGF